MQSLITQGLMPPAADSLQRSVQALENRLRTAGRGGVDRGSGELKNAAREFESLFVAYLFKVMRETIEEAGVGESSGFGKSIYTELFDQEVSRGIAQRSVLGIADLVMKGLGIPEEPALPDPSTGQSPARAPKPAVGAPASGPSDGGGGRPEISETMLPVAAAVSSDFGLRRDPLGRQVRFHKGLDLAAPEGTPVQAVADGEVAFAGLQKGYGNTVVVRHPDGLETRYAHLASLSVRTGDAVRAQTVVGAVGTTGRSTGPHLHFEVVRWGNAVNPRYALAD